LPTAVTVAIRDQAAGGSGINTANSSARWALNFCNEG
jgi:hypothetical protein